MPRVTVLENIRENAPSVSERVFRKSKKKPTDYSLNLSWRRWPILVIFMVYGMTSTFQITQYVVKPELFRLRYFLQKILSKFHFLRNFLFLFFGKFQYFRTYPESFSIFSKRPRKGQYFFSILIQWVTYKSASDKARIFWANFAYFLPNFDENSWLADLYVTHCTP